MAIKKVLLDSSIWLSSILKEDVNHKKADKIFEKYLSHEYQIIVPQPVLVEVINVLYRKNGSFHNINGFLRETFKNENIIMSTINNYYMTKSIAEILKIGNIRSQDLYILIYCKYLKIDIFETFDKKQKDYYIKNVI